MNRPAQLGLALAAVTLFTLPAMAADNNNTSVSLSKDSTKVCTKSGDCPPGFKHSRSMRRGFGPRLQLTDDQLEKMAVLKNNFKVSVGPQIAQLKSLKFQLKDQLLQATVDKDKVMSLQSNINSIKADLATKRLGLKLDKLALLTSDQKQILRHKMLLKENFGGFRGHKGHRFTAHRGFRA